MLASIVKNANNTRCWLGSFAMLDYETRQVRKEAAVVIDACAEM